MRDCNCAVSEVEEYASLNGNRCWNVLLNAKLIAAAINNFRKSLLEILIFLHVPL